MLTRIALSAFLLSGAFAQQSFTAKSYTGWDCCKPICANIPNNQSLLSSRGAPKVCDRDNNALGQDASVRATTGCANGGTGFLCQDYQPIPVEPDLSYGFAIQVGGGQAGTNPNCCKCYEVQWRSGKASGKKMIVQSIYPGQTGGDVRNNDLIILTPGGGLGPESSGCPRQYGNTYRWGDVYGGFSNRQGCEGLPTNLQAGCYWRFNWAGGEINGWDINYRQVSCPSRLTDISGCSA